MKCPSTALEMRTPEKVWSGHPPNLNRLKVFGCLSYAHIRQDKLKLRVVKCMFLGYPEGVKGYMLQCLERDYERCIILSHDVVFNETHMAYKIDSGMSKSSNDQNEKDEYEKLNLEVEPKDKADKGQSKD